MMMLIRMLLLLLKSNQDDKDVDDEAPENISRRFFSWDMITTFGRRRRCLRCWWNFHITSLNLWVVNAVTLVLFLLLRLLLVLCDSNTERCCAMGSQATTDNWQQSLCCAFAFAFLAHAIERSGPLDIISFLPRWLTRKSERDSKRRGIEIVGGGVNCKTILIFFNYKFFSFDSK